MAQVQTKQHAHELIDRLSSGQVSAVIGLLEAMLDPVSVALASAPDDDEPVSKEEVQEIAEAHAASARDELISNDEVLRELGLSAEEFKRMGRTPLETEQRHSKQ